MQPVYSVASYLTNAFREHSQIDTDRLIRKIGWLWHQAELADNTTSSSTLSS